MLEPYRRAFHHSRYDRGKRMPRHVRPVRNPQRRNHLRDDARRGRLPRDVLVVQFPHCCTGNLRDDALDRKLPGNVHRVRLALDAPAGSSRYVGRAFLLRPDVRQMSVLDRRSGPLRDGSGRRRLQADVSKLLQPDVHSRLKPDGNVLWNLLPDVRGMQFDYGRLADHAPARRYRRAIFVSRHVQSVL